MQTRTITRRALTETEMRAYAPSIFAVSAHESRTSKFVPVPSWEIVQKVMDAGFVPVRVSQSRTRDASRRDFTRHMIRFQPAEAQMLAVGDTVPNALLVNGNDGSSAFRLYAGAERLVCLNGLCMPLPGGEAISIPHKGNDVGKRVIDATYEVVEHAKRSLEAPKTWSQIELVDEEMVALAEAARVIRFGDAEGNVSTHVTARALLESRRAEDNGSDLWKTFNRIQENATKGGQSAYGRSPTTGRRRRTTSREITGIDQDIRVNRGLWILAEALAKAKN